MNVSSASVLGCFTQILCSYFRPRIVTTMCLCLGSAATVPIEITGLEFLCVPVACINVYLDEAASQDNYWGGVFGDFLLLKQLNFIQ